MFSFVISDQEYTRKSVESNTEIVKIINTVSSPFKVSNIESINNKGMFSLFIYVLKLI